MAGRRVIRQRESRLRIAAGAVVAVCGLAALSVAQDTVTLREEAYVKGPTVLLGDVAQIEGSNKEFLATIEVAPAAQPGASRHLHAALVETRLREAGVDAGDVSVRGSSRVTATTRHLEITRGMISESLRRFIESQMPWSANDTTIDIVPPTHEYIVPDGEVAFAWRPSPQYGYLGQGAFRGELLVDGRVERSFFCKANVEAYAEVPVAAAEISRGDLVSPRQLRFETRALSALKDGAFLDAREAVGQVARSTIFPGQVLTSHKLEPPVLVERGKSVIVETHIGALSVRTRARAMQDGAAGEVIPCMNPESKQEFLGVVREDGVVEVK